MRTGEEENIMEKKKTKKTKPGDLNPDEQCEKIGNEVDKILLDQCRKKVNTLKKCKPCDITHKTWPVINSPLDAKLLNTGFDGVNGTLPDGSIDLHWEAGEGTTTGDESDPTTVNNWIPAYVKSCPAWIPSPFNNANWISIYEDAKHPEEEEEKPDKDIYFRCWFYLHDSIVPSQFSLEMDFYVDNSVYEIYVNGVPQSQNPICGGQLPQAPPGDEYSYEGFKSGNKAHISLSKDWQPCKNDIIVHVKSSWGLVGFLAQNAAAICSEAAFPNLTPAIKISWGDSDCDCLETDDYEVLCITVCNGYSNVLFKNFSIGKITVVDENYNPVPSLPDGTPSVELHPIGPYCFGDIPACGPGGNNCVSREFVLFNRGAIPGKYKLRLEGICFDVCKRFAQNDCFEFSLCKS
jgi:hypothetical protein